MAASGEIQRPPMGSFPWPPSRVAPKGTGSSAIRTDEASRSSLASRAGELHREVGSVLLATFAEVPRGTADLGSIDVTDVCDP
jgi:hypothetical protein